MKNLDGQKSEKYANMNFEIDEDKMEQQIYYNIQNYYIFFLTLIFPYDRKLSEKFPSSKEENLTIPMLVELSKYTF